ncbi:hypothetical protein AOLI_G00184450 [Acnodon oligacanthus]
MNAKYKAIMKQKMEELEHEREMMRNPVAAIRQSEERSLSAVHLVVIQKHRLIQELQKRVSPILSETMCKLLSFKQRLGNKPCLRNQPSICCFWFLIDKDLQLVPGRIQNKIPSSR